MAPPIPIDKNKKKTVDEKALEVARLTRDAVLAFENTFRVLKDPENKISYAEVTAPGVLHPIDRENVLGALVSRYIGSALPSLVKREVLPSWTLAAAKHNGLTHAEVVPIQFLSGEAPWTWQRLPFDPDDSATCPPEYAAMLARTSPDEGKSLTLWLGSLLDHEFPRSQYLYLWGEGNDGKSTLIRTLSRALSRQGVAYMSADDFRDSHAGTKLEGARLLVFADENSASFMSRGKFKSLTGDDEMTVNPKGMPRRNIRLNCKVMVASNYPPQVAGGTADMRRILPVGLRPIPLTRTSHREGKAFVEAGTRILQYCYKEFKAWQLRNPDRMIPAGDAAMEEIAADSMQEVLKHDITGIFEYSPEFEVSAALVHSTLKGILRNNSAIKDAYQVMVKQGATRYQNSETRLRYWKGVRLVSRVI